MRRLKRLLFETEEEEVPINLTPLIDVVFIVLISFILIAPMLSIDSVDLAQEGSFSTKCAQDASLTISLRKDNALLFNGKRISQEELKSLLAQSHAQNPSQIPRLIPDRGASFGAYQEVKNLCELSGFSQMEIVLQPTP